MDFNEEVDKLNRNLKELEETLETVKETNAKEKENLANQICQRENEVYELRQALETSNRKVSETRE